MNVETVTIEAPGDWSLVGTLFQPLGEPAQGAPVALISAAAAVPQSYYTKFASHLIDVGAAAVLTYDYRGMAKSAGDRSRWPSLHMKDWALLDLPAATSFMKDRFPNNPLVGAGHSYGGQALGLSGVSQAFERYATVATMSGYWRGLDEPWSVWLQTQMVGSPIAKLLGRIPRWAGFGEEFPGTVFLNWAKWIRKDDYFFSDPELPEITRFRDVELPLLSVGIEDDSWGTHRAVNSFMKAYTNADLRQIWLKPGESGPIGHLGYFRQKHRDEHWPIVTNFLLNGDWPADLKQTA